MIEVKRNKFLIGIGIFVAILVLTNPTNKDLEDYCGEEGKKKLNLLIFSVYEVNIYHHECPYCEKNIIDYSDRSYRRIHTKKIYFGVIKNFIPVYSEIQKK